MDEKAFAQVKEKYGQAVKDLADGKTAAAGKALKDLISTHESSTDPSVQQILNQAKIRLAVVESRESPEDQIDLKTPEDKINEAVYALNAGRFQRARDLLGGLEKGSHEKSYVLYLLSLVCLKQEDVKASLGYLKKAVQKDDHYKHLAFNEPDFEPLVENREFLTIVHPSQS